MIKKIYLFAKYKLRNILLRFLGISELLTKLTDEVVEIRDDKDRLIIALTNLDILVNEGFKKLPQYKTQITKKINGFEYLLKTNNQIIDRISFDLDYKIEKVQNSLKYLDAKSIEESINIKMEKMNEIFGNVMESQRKAEDVLRNLNRLTTYP